MKKKTLSILLAAVMAAGSASAVNAYTEQELLEYQAWTSQQLDSTYARIDQLYDQRVQLESEIADLDYDLFNVLVSIDVTKSDIEAKKEEIAKTETNLERAENAKAKQYEAMKSRIQYLYENGGDTAWFQMMLNAEDLGDFLNRAEYTQQMYDADRKNLELYANAVTEVQGLKDQYESEKAELEEMEASLEQQSAELQYQIEVKQAASDDVDYELACAQEEANNYVALLMEQQAELERLEAERIAAQEEARRQAEAAEAAAYEAQQAGYEAYYRGEVETLDEAAAYAQEYYENGGYMDNGSSSGEASYTESGDTYTEYEYDEYGNVIDNSEGTYDSGSSGSSSSTSYSGSGSSVVDFATQYVGNPYVWGGTSLTDGADCSGFVQSVYANFGVDLPRTSYEQQNAGYEVPYSEAQPGDLICYGGHVAIYMGNGQIVHASNSRDGIKISDDATYRTILSVRRLV